MKKSLQYELWEECNSKCTYCSLGIENLFTKKEYKIQSLQLACDEISQLSEPYDVIGFIGGEFFQGQLNDKEVYDNFMDLMKITNYKVNSGMIKEVWLNATLTIGDQKDLYTAIDLFDDKSKLWILTSYDTIGRFHSQKMLETWEYHINNIHKLYPEIRINTTSILTGDFIKKYINDEIDLSDFKKKYNTTLFFKSPVKPDHMSLMRREDINKILGDFFPTRDEFIKFLLKYKLKEGLELYKNLFNNDLKSEEVRKNYNDDSLRNVIFKRDSNYKETLNCNPSLKAIATLKCGHSGIYQCYSDSDHCCICDKLMIEDV